METSGFGGYVVILWLTILLLRLRPCSAGFQNVGQISPGLEGTQMNWVDHDGVFLQSNNSEFGFGFTNPQEVTQYFLAIIHLSTRKIVWMANRGSPVSTSDKFSFNKNGNVMLYKESKVVWSTETMDKGVSALALMDSGNLVLLGADNAVIWQSFSHPTDTLLSNQDFVEGMRLVSNPGSNNLTYFLELKSGDLVLSVGFKTTPQSYWSMSKENRKTINKDGGSVTSATLTANSWNFHGENDVLLWQFSFSPNTDANATWIAILGDDGFISFYKLQSGGSGEASSVRIPGDHCGTPEPCGSNFICYSENKCLCPSILGSHPNCQTGIASPCDQSMGPAELVESEDNIGYFALQFMQPSLTTDLEDCKASCRNNCSCVALFFQASSGGCFLFDEVGGFQNSKSSEFVSYIKLVKNGEDGGSNGGNESGEKKPIAAILGIAFATVVVICGLIYVGIRFVRKKKQSPGPQESSDEDNFLEGLSGAPIRYCYADLQTATDNFLVKLGQGGFGSVYRGALPDGTRLAVKKLEGIGQGKKEFRAEVGIIGSIHHIHLVRLKGFCAEGTHRLLAYEFMANGSLDKWIFKRNRGEFLLDWNARFNIALGTAKGLAYLHEDCDAKIVHCDIKPENVLLDDNFHAKVSDFGLAKLMNREQSHVFTTLRGTRGYLAPEWITNYAISEKSDVYSYGMVLLEIIGGRKNYDPTETSEKSHFPTYAFKMMEEGKLRAILDAKLNINDSDERVSIAIKVALWCVQEDMHQRPPMARVVQMLEGVCAVPQPPTCSPLGSRLVAAGFLKSSSEEWTSSGPSDCNSDAYLSSVQLSGPR